LSSLCFYHRVLQRMCYVLFQLSDSYLISSRAKPIFSVKTKTDLKRFPVRHRDAEISCAINNFSIIDAVNVIIYSASIFIYH